MSTYFVKVTLDDVPEYMDGIFRCGSVITEDEDGNQIKDHPDLVDNTEFSSQTEMVEYIANQLNVPTDVIMVE